MRDLLARLAAFTRLTSVRLALAAAMIALVLVPAGWWNTPEVDGTYRGFDPITMYSDPSGDGSGDGSVTFDDDRLVLAAGPNSQPIVHLATGPLSYTSTFDVTVNDAGEGGDAFVATIWAPYPNHRVEVAFEGSPTQRIVGRRVESGELVEVVPLGVYAVNQTYSLRASVDRTTDAVALDVSSADDLLAGDALALQDAGTTFESHVISAAIDVAAETEYVFEAVVKDLATGLNGLSIEWLDVAGQRLAIDSSWELERPGCRVSQTRVASERTCRCGASTSRGGGGRHGQLVVRQPRPVALSVADH